MTTNCADLHSSLADEQLLARVKSLAGVERHATVDLIAALAEVDRRKLYLAEGFPSLFNYCTHVLHLSEHAAYAAGRCAERGFLELHHVVPFANGGEATAGDIESETNAASGSPPAARRERAVVVIIYRFAGPRSMRASGSVSDRVVRLRLSYRHSRTSAAGVPVLRLSNSGVRILWRTLPLGRQRGQPAEEPRGELLESQEHRTFLHACLL
jgi:hypothetical protein